MKTAHVVFMLEPRIRDHTFEDQAAADRVGYVIANRFVGARINGVDVRSVEYQPSARPLLADYVYLETTVMDGSEHDALRPVIDQEIARLVTELAD